jgi:hypothetical protein
MSPNILYGRLDFATKIVALLTALVSFSILFKKNKKSAYALLKN